MSPGRAERHGFENYRHGTLSLFAALDVKTGQVHGKTAARHTSEEFVDFLGEVVALCKPKQQVHIIVDNLSMHKTHNVTEFLEDPRASNCTTPRVFLLAQSGRDLVRQNRTQCHCPTAYSLP